METRLIEIFSSIQGEGPYLGVRQIFLRFAGCNLKCAYCDTPFEPMDKFRVEYKTGSGNFDYFNNQVTPSEVASILNSMELESNHSISLTGGEPLLHAGFILELAELLKEKKVKFYLETNGTLPDQLEKVLDVIDIISMDIKLPGSAACGNLWAAHEAFLKIGQCKEIFVKIVVSSDTSNQEVNDACETIRKVDRNIPLIIQPVDSHKGFPDKSPSMDKLIEIQGLGFNYLTDVRIIPQTHKLMGIL